MEVLLGPQRAPPAQTGCRGPCAVSQGKGSDTGHNHRDYLCRGEEETMRAYRFALRSLIVIAFTVGAFLWLTPGQGQAQREEVVKAGRPTYEQYCAVCHGPAGKGDGGAATLLTVKPADLTQLSKKNNGVFPFWQVYRVIDGREEVKGHGTREMPIWGRSFACKREAGAR